jgi:hypothetical protein
MARDPMHSPYSVSWVDDQGVTHNLTLVFGYPDEEKWITLDGIMATERQAVAIAVVAALPELVFTCIDEHVRTTWKASMSRPNPGELGSYELSFAPLDR